MPIDRHVIHARSRALCPLGPAALVLVLALGVVLPARAAGPAPKPVPAPPGLAEFMGGLAQIESGGRYDARNRDSGAYGKYQIMPFNWPAWAGRYLGNRKAKQSGPNQERVAAGRLSDLYRSLGGSWDRTAYWWLTGKHGPRGTGSRSAGHYVGRGRVG